MSTRPRIYHLGLYTEGKSCTKHKGRTKGSRGFVWRDRHILLHISARFIRGPWQRRWCEARQRNRQGRGWLQYSGDGFGVHKPFRKKRVHQFYCWGCLLPRGFWTRNIYVRFVESTLVGYDYVFDWGGGHETVAEETIWYCEDVDPVVGLMPFQARRVAFNLGLSGNGFKEMVRFKIALYTAYVSLSLFEINPVLKTSDNKILAVDAKVSLDENIFRHKDYQALRDLQRKSRCWRPKKLGSIYGSRW